MIKNAWASKPLEGGISQTLSAIEASLHVALIATFDFKSCEVGDKVEKVFSRPELEKFDFIGARDSLRDSFASRHGIVGVLNRLKTPPGELTAGEAMQPLDESILISANASILAFIENADTHPYRLLLHGERIVGIVTLSDLQKFAVRPVLFTLIASVELLLAEWLRQKYPDEKQWLATFSEGRQAIIEQRWKDWASDNTAMDKISVTEFCDKREAALNLGAFPSKNAARKQLRDVEWLRHAVMQSADYALTPENAQRVARTVRAARQLIQVLQDAVVTSS